AVDLGVDPADEERGDAADGRQVAVVGLEPSDVGLHDLGVAVEADDEGDVDAPALGDQGTDGLDALGGGRHLDEQVGLADLVVEPAGGGDRAVEVVGQVGGDLHRHVAVDAVAGVVHRPHDRQGGPDV